MLPNLFGEKLDELAIERIQAYEPDDGYYLAFSGGKDSVVLHDLAERAEVQFDAHYNVTGIDPPEVVRFIVEHYPGVEFEKPEMLFVEGVEKRGLPYRTGRWCCDVLKEPGGENRTVLIGVRASESRMRAQYGVVKHCKRRSKVLISPMLDWTDEQVWGYIRGRELPYCSLYDEGWSRIGCIPCPFVSGQEIAKRRQRWPKVFERIRRAVQVAYKRHPATQARWDSADDFYEWWLARDSGYPSANDEQRILDFT